MSAEEFWKDDPQLFYSYRLSFIEKKKREMEETDYKCWLMGLYVHDGNGKLNQSLKQFIGNMFSKQKNKDKISTYPEKPYFEQQKIKKDEENIKEKEKDKRYQNFQSSLAYFGTMKQRYTENIINKSKKGE